MLKRTAHHPVIQQLPGIFPALILIRISISGTGCQFNLDFFSMNSVYSCLNAKTRPFGHSKQSIQSLFVLMRLLELCDTSIMGWLAYLFRTIKHFNIVIQDLSPGFIGAQSVILLRFDGSAASQNCRQPTNAELNTEISGTQKE